MLLVQFKTTFQCPWTSNLRSLGIRSEILQCIPRRDSQGSSVLATFKSSSSRPGELRSLLLESLGVDEVSLKSTSKDDVMVGLIKTKRCTCYEVGIPFMHVLRIREEGDGLTITCAFRDADELKDFIEESVLRGYRLQVRRVERLDADLSMPSLTKKQEQLLSAALELGFYEVPKRVGIRELAEMFGVSPRAVSETIRRAHKRLISSYLGR
ncbi:MAG: helix-turn-helix domain-containing protein [Thaumarchaeota archaeon]|nr:helix-turn-helix domain-containing protein [Candidatus Calditenuaceae archaeon]